MPHGVDDALATATLLGTLATSPGRGSTRDLWEALATAAAYDLGAARAIEPHLDALAILEQAGTRADESPAPARTWGVFAAEGGPDPLVARPGGRGWLLTGTKPWCSLAGRLSDALVSARTPDGDRMLFAVSLSDPGVSADSSAWHARGLSEIPSGPVHFDSVAAEPVGGAGWYLERVGFAWGGIGVAACWFGGAVGIARGVYAASIAGEPSPFLLMHLGAIDELVESSRRALAEAASLVDAGQATGAAGGLLAKRVRATVARACEEIAIRAGHALGPAPLALDADHAKRVADLQLYVRQHHAERDQSSLGRALVAAGGAPW
jgi:alkylation response protein AidB-like acyl-CoA dehydrogenase